MITVSISLALICFLGECHHALVGHNTPVGKYQLVQRLTDQRGYGGDVLQFAETPTSWYAIHRVWTLKPSQHRVERLESNDPSYRVITNGCINIDPTVYEKLRSCCTNDTLVVTP